MTGREDKDGVNQVNSEQERFDDVQPVPPTSGEILGAVVRKLGLKDPALSSKSAQRYFRGGAGAILKDSSLDEVTTAIARVVIDAGLVPGAESGDDAPIPFVSEVIRFNAREWDSLVTHMRRGSQHVDRRNLPAVWAAFFRLLTIDVAIRIGAAMWITDTHPENLESLDYLNRSARGDLLNWIRNDGKKRVANEEGTTSVSFTLDGLAEVTGADRHTVENWLHKGARPNDEHLQAIAATVAKVSGDHWEMHMLRHLRRFYWASDLAELIKGIIGQTEQEDMVAHLLKYSELSYRALYKTAHLEDGTKQLMDVFFARGPGLDLSSTVAYWMSEREEDPTWRQYLEAIAFDGWAKHIWRVIRRIRRNEIDSLDEPTHAALMRNWSVSNPEAYELYEQSVELRAEGKMDEAIALVERSLKLDPTDPTYHFTLGSIYGAIGARSGDDEFLQKGLDALHVAAQLAPEWLAPWTTIGFVLIEAGRHQEAVDHLLAADPKRDQQEAEYYLGLAFAYDGIGEYRKALDAVERGLEYAPQNRHLAMGSAMFAAKLGFGQRARKYRRLVRHLGGSDLDLLALDWWIKNGRETEQSSA